jgi:hypothetical protein
MISRDEQLRLTEPVRALQQNPPADGHAMLDSLVRSAGESVPGAQYAAITIIRGHAVETAVTTDPYPIVLDEIQRREGEGPALSAAWEHHTIRIDDLTTDARWPRYCCEALQWTPIRSGLSLRLFANRQTAGALSLYANRSYAFGDDALQVGLAFATLLALAWDILQRDKQFRSALASRDVIGQAKGILMERFGTDADSAFDLLKRLSQASNTPLTEVVDRLVHSDCRPRQPHPP